MNKKWFPSTVPVFLFILIIFGLLIADPARPASAWQVAATPSADAAMYITVITDEPQINVRLGPSSSIYPVVGTLPTGTTVPALGRSLGGDWIQIEFPGAPNGAGWVYAPLVQVSPGTLRIAEPPPTPVPPATPTIDPTLVAQFNIPPTPTRLPTFTPPPALVLPFYTEVSAPSIFGSISLALVILILFILGVVFFVLSMFLFR